jgi:acyl transferase domain-containing protein
MQKLAGGAMLSVPLTAEEMRPLLGEGLSLAAVNAESLCVISGGAEAIDQLQKRLKERGITSSRLQTSHAFHSEMMNPIMEPFAELIKKVNLREPHVPYVSNVTGNWITGTEATDPHYWVKHLRQTVLFAEGLRHFVDDPKWIFLEIGPGNTLCSFAQRAKTDAHIALSSLRHPLQSTPDAAFMLASLGHLWMAGVRTAWSKVNADATHYRVPLPTYPFERQRYWIDRREGIAVDRSGEQLQPVKDDELAIGTPLHPRPGVANSFTAARTNLEHSVAGVWQERLGIAQIGVQDNFYELGGDSLLATQIVAELREMFAIELSLNHFFDKQTIAGVAECIEEILVAEVSNLSDTEAQQLLQ